MNRFLACSLALALASPLAAQPVPPPPQDAAALFAAQNRIPDTPGDGPYPAMMEVDSGLPDHVIYRPADFGGLAGEKLGVFLSNKRLQGLPAILEVAGKDNRGPDADEIRKTREIYERWARKRRRGRRSGSSASRSGPRGTRG